VDPPIKNGVQAKSKFDHLSDIFGFISLVIKHDRYRAGNLLKIFDHEFFGLITRSLVLCPETEELVASIVSLSTNISNLIGLDTELEIVIAQLHCVGFRACLLLPAHYSALQIEFLSTYFTGSVFECKLDGVSQSMAKMAIDESVGKDSLENVLPVLANLRALFLSLAKKFVPKILTDRSRDIIESRVCEALIIGPAGLTATLPMDLTPFFIGRTQFCTRNLRIWSFLGQETYIYFVTQETRIIRKLFIFVSKRSKSTMQRLYFYWNSL